LRLRLRKISASGCSFRHKREILKALKKDPGGRTGRDEMDMVEGRWERGKGPNASYY